MPTELTIAAHITRTELSLPNLIIHKTTPPTYEILNDPSVNPGAITWRRQWVTSPFVHGSVEVHAVRDLMQMELRLLLVATDHTVLQARVDECVKGFSQSTYELHLTIEGVNYTWECFRADIGVRYDWQYVQNRKAFVNLVIPRKSEAKVGPI